MSWFSPCEKDYFGAAILTAFSARFSKRLSRSFRRPLRGRVEERRFAGHEPLHSVDRRILVRRVGPGSVAQAHRHPWQLEVFVEGEGGHRAPARRPDLRLLPVRLDGLDRGLRDPRTRVGLRGAVRTVHLDPQVVISAFLQVGAQFAQRSFDRHVLDQSDVDLRVRLVREHRFRAAVFDVPRVNAADVHGRLEEVFQEELIFRQIELELRRPFLLKPGGRVKRLREGLHHRGISLRRRDDIVPDSIDGRTLVLVDQGVERLQQPPDRGADPDCVRAVDFAVHRTAGLRVAAGPDREIQAPFHAQVDRGHAAQVLGVVVRDRRVRLQFSTVSPDVRDEIRATDLFLALREDLQVHRHLVDVADRLPGEEVVREGALRVRRAAADDRSADAGNVANLRGKGRRLPRLEVPDRLNVIHLVHDQGDGRAHVQLADDERMTAFRPGAGLAADVRHHLADKLRALPDPFAGRAHGGLTQQPARVLEGLREPRVESPADLRRRESGHRRGNGNGPIRFSVSRIAATFLGGAAIASPMLRIEADILIPGRGDPIHNAALIVDGPTIAYAGPIEGAHSAAGAAVVNVPVLMPGMWDVHGHLMGIRTLNVEEIARTPLAVLAARATKDAEVAVSAGFTSIRELSGLGVHLARVVAEGTVRGPHIYGAGGALSQTGGHGDLHAFPLDFIHDVLRRTGFSYLCDGVPAGLKGVRMQLRLAARGIMGLAFRRSADKPHQPDHAPMFGRELGAIGGEAARADGWRPGPTSSRPPVDRPDGGSTATRWAISSRPE